MDHSLDEMLTRAAAGDERAWRQLVEAYSGRVYGVVYRQCGDRELSEEITQSTFVKVVQKLDGYNESGRFEAWLFRIATNRLRDEMRRRKRQANTVDFTASPPESIGFAGRGDESPDRPLVEAERNTQLAAAVATLPEADQELLHMRYVGELSYQQIADTLEQPLGTVLARGHRALKKLKAKLAEEAA